MSYFALIRLKENDFKESSREDLIEEIHHIYDYIDMYESELEKLSDELTIIKKENENEICRHHDELRKVNKPLYVEKPCLNCEENKKQFTLMKAAFERRKEEQQALKIFFKKYNYSLNGKKASYSQIVKEGKELKR